MVKIVFNNNQACFVQLWRWLERTRQLLRLHNKRFCIRRVLQAWFGIRATEDFIWEVCNLCQQSGWDEMQPPSLFPRRHRELLRAIVAVRLGISFFRVNLRALDAAYCEAFPRSTPLNVSKKRHRNIPKTNKQEDDDTKRNQKQQSPEHPQGTH
jgi:hypothetical protein